MHDEETVIFYMNSISRCFKELNKLFISTCDDVSCSGMPGTIETTMLPSTLPETNIDPENRPLEKEIPIGNRHF